MSILKTKSVSNSRIANLKKNLLDPKNLITMNILLDKEIHHKFKVKAAMNGVTMTDVITLAIEDYIK
jgi:hypothetical protein